MSINNNSASISPSLSPITSENVVTALDKPFWICFKSAALIVKLSVTLSRMSSETCSANLAD